MDNIEISNLHRQVIHSDCNAGVMNKAVSACKAMKDLNPTVQCTAIQQALSYENALDLVSMHDCIVDASDNPRTRYLLNDACVLAGKTFVSGSAMGTEGQMTVYKRSDHDKGSACYRCLYPRANPSEGCKVRFIIRYLAVMYEYDCTAFAEMIFLTWFWLVLVD